MKVGLLLMLIKKHTLEFDNTTFRGSAAVLHMMAASNGKLWGGSLIPLGDYAPDDEVWN